MTYLDLIKQKFVFWIEDCITIYNHSINQKVKIPFMFLSGYSPKWIATHPEKTIYCIDKKGNWLILQLSTFQWKSKQFKRMTKFNNQIGVKSFLIDLAEELNKKEPEVEKVYRKYLRIEEETKKKETTEKAKILVSIIQSEQKELDKLNEEMNLTKKESHLPNFY